ncbi:hypothetical protein ACWDSD_29040, partial [Streptomyces spiralis]
MSHPRGHHPGSALGRLGVPEGQTFLIRPDGEYDVLLRQGRAGPEREAVAAVLTLHNRLVPPTLGCSELDEEIGLDV